jgi:hypothetical protein
MRIIYIRSPRSSYLIEKESSSRFQNSWQVRRILSLDLISTQMNALYTIPSSSRTLYTD